MAKRIRRFALALTALADAPAEAPSAPSFATLTRWDYTADDALGEMLAGARSGLRKDMGF